MTEALMRHWKLSCSLEAGSDKHPPLDIHRWKYDDNDLLVDWDSEENISNVKSRVALIKIGCGCRTGCTSARCK